MKRIQEKVKDLVEVRSYRSLNDFLSDLTHTLNAYHFTDFTAEMMSKWLDQAAEVGGGRGKSKALAGYRGVGKSHFLATFGAILAYPEHRPRIGDTIVSAAAERLKRRRHPVAYARRGTNSSLFEELKDGVAQALEIDRRSLDVSLPELLNKASEKAGDVPFVIIIDTAFDRTARVSRDDGILLGEIAELAKKLNIFVAVALDDDIAGADGVNAAISRNYTIDYLDQEHLYRVVDAHIFPKYRNASPPIHDIYVNFRGLLPGFRWSEQRFSALYPLHPLILEIAPFVRLYVPEFALLSFASEAGAKVLGRPANSLVGLDEVFDLAEAGLRKSADLKELFVAYDKLNTDIVAQISVMHRLQAKLILKALVLLSFDGTGTTASEIAAAMLIYDENDHAGAIARVSEILDKFAAALPDAVDRFAEEEAETKYSFKFAGKDNLNEALTRAARAIPRDRVPQILRRLAADRFADWQQSDDEVDVTDAAIEWRGGMRRGRLVWNWNETSNLRNLTPPDESCDWEIFVNAPQKNPISATNPPIPILTWQPAPLSDAETETILRYRALVADEADFAEYGEQARAAAHTLSAAVNRIWTRIFIEEGKINYAGAEYDFSANVFKKHSLSELLQEMLSSILDVRHPHHPIYSEILGAKYVLSLVGDLFGGARQTLSETQFLAGNFAAPLGLVTLHGDLFYLETEENVNRLSFVAEIKQKIADAHGQTVLLGDIYKYFRRSPHGLLRESVQLILSALVALRQIEFVTSKGDRINRRSLDLKIIWDDIVGIAPPVNAGLSNAALTDWARLLTGREDLKAIDDPQEREIVREALQNWLETFSGVEVFEKFEKLSEEKINTKIWRLAANARKSFGAVGEIVKGLLSEGVSTEEGLQRIADAFAGSEKEFHERRKDLARLADFVATADLREKIWNYLAVCEITDDTAVEQMREDLFALLEELASYPSENGNLETESLWLDFKVRYAEIYVAKHDSVMKSANFREEFEELLRGDRWWEFECLSALPVLQKQYWAQAQKIINRYRSMNCAADAADFLTNQPRCICNFRFGLLDNQAFSAAKLSEIVEKAGIGYRKTLMILREALIPALEKIAVEAEGDDYRRAASFLRDIFESGETIPPLDHCALTVLQKAFSRLPAAPMLKVDLPEENGFLNRSEIVEKFSEWFEELPGDPVLVKI